jgi:outer membrane protein assembly factor BamB
METGLADRWPAEGPPVLWVKDIGHGYSGFCVAGGRVWTQHQTLYAQTVLCLDADTGRTIWEYPYGTPYEAAGMYPGPRATPTWHDGRVYFAGPDGLIGCLRAGDGRLLWSVNVNKQFSGRGTDFGYACSPTVLNGKVILPVGGPGASLVALKADDGTTVWADGEEPASYCSALPITFQGRSLIVGYLQNALTLHELDTGRLLWRYPLSHGYDEHAAIPLYDEPNLMISGPFRSGAELLRIESVSANHVGRPSEASRTGTLARRQSESDSGTLARRQESDGQECPSYEIHGRRVWHCRELSNDVASSVLVEGYVYGFDLRDLQSKARRPSRGEFRCLDFQTGKVCWSSDRPGHASLIAADGKLVMLNDRGEVLLVRATPDAYEELGRVRIFGDEICWTSPSLDRGRLYVRSPTRAACLYLGQPGKLEPQRLATARSASQIPERRRWNVAWLAGGERDCPADPPDRGETLRWYGVCLGVLGSAAVLALFVWAAVRFAGWAGWLAARIVFWAALIVLSVAATLVGNRLGGEFVFTWPVALFAVQQLVLAGVLWSRRHREQRRARWLPIASALVLLMACLVYYDLCRRCDLAMMWLFLVGLVPCWPLAVPAAYQFATAIRPFRDMLWAVLTFSAYYWVSAAYAIWFLCG